MFSLPKSRSYFLFPFRDKNTLLAFITPVLNGIISQDVALKGPALYVCLWEFDREYLKNNTNKDQRWRNRVNLGPVS